MEEVKYPLWEKIAGVTDTTQLIPLYTDRDSAKRGRTLIQQVLVFHRGYFMSIKERMLKRIVSLGEGKQRLWRRFLSFVEVIRLVKAYPDLTYENTLNTNTHTMMGITERFLKYEDNPGREPLFRAIFKLAMAKFEYDNYYASRRDFIIEEIIIAILNGEWEPRPVNWPDPKWWHEPLPFGGEHSIVYKMKEHRHEILELLKEKGKCL